jgi:hypothetical protein
VPVIALFFAESPDHDSIEFPLRLDALWRPWLVLFCPLRDQRVLALALSDA